MPSSDLPGRQSDVLPVVSRPSSRKVLSITSAGAVVGGRAAIESILGEGCFAARQSESACVTLDVPDGVEVHIVHPVSRLTTETLRGGVRLLLEPLLSAAHGAESVPCTVKAARSSTGGIKNFAAAQVPVSESTAGGVSDRSDAGSPAAPDRAPGRFRQFLCRLAVAVGLVEKEEKAFSLSGAVEGGRHVSDTVELARKFLAETGMASHFRDQYLADVLTRAEGDMRTATKDPKRMQEISAALDSIGDAPHFGDVVAKLARHRETGGDGTLASGLAGGGGGSEEARIVSRFGDLRETAAVRLARLRGEASGTYGVARKPARSQNVKQTPL